MQTCSSCGKPLDIEDDIFCPYCGAFTQEEHKEVVYRPIPKPMNRRTDLSELPDAGPSAFSRYGQVSESEYLKHLLLMMIPLFGLLFAFGKTRMDGRETFCNFAAAMCIMNLMIWGGLALWVVL